MRHAGNLRIGPRIWFFVMQYVDAIEKIENVDIAGAYSEFSQTS